MSCGAVMVTVVIEMFYKVTRLPIRRTFICSSFRSCVDITPYADSADYVLPTVGLATVETNDNHPTNISFVLSMPSGFLQRVSEFHLTSSECSSILL
jgi:hypothetical protein